ncbi:MAG: metal-dependent phosphohydrolase [Cyanobacteria bacterium P01_A01_bin.123]
MFDSTQMTVDAFFQQIKVTYASCFDATSPYLETFEPLARQVLGAIAQSDAAYHTVDHTLLVLWVGHSLLQGKHTYERTVTGSDWLHTMMALLCHDVGYLKGICPGDQPAYHRYMTGKGDRPIILPPQTTDASLTPYHVDRSQRFVEVFLANHDGIDPKIVTENIEMTRFPIPTGERYADTLTYPGLCRAADLVGQLSDPRYLQKLPALYREFEETGMNQALGYQHVGELRASYPRFYWDVIYPYICDSLRYLAVTKAGRRIIASLYTNVYLVELEQQRSETLAPAPHWEDTVFITQDGCAITLGRNH